MVVHPLAKSMGAPEAIVAMGAVLEARAQAPMDLFVRAPTITARVRTAVRGPGIIPAGFGVAAAAVALWAGAQFSTLLRTRHEIAALTDSITRAQSTIAPLQQAVEARAGLATLHIDLQGSVTEQQRLLMALRRLAIATPQGLRIDSLTVRRTLDGWRASFRIHSTAATGGEAIRGINGLYQSLAFDPVLKNLAVDDSFAWATTDEGKDSVAATTRGNTAAPPVRVSAGLSFVVPIEAHP